MTETRTIEVSNEFQVIGIGSGLAMVRGELPHRRVLATEDTGMWARAAKFAAMLPKGISKIAVLGSGMMVLQRVLQFHDWEIADSYEKDDKVADWAEEHAPFWKQIRGDWKDTLDRDYDVIVWDLDQPPTNDEVEALEACAPTILCDPEQVENV